MAQEGCLGPAHTRLRDTALLLDLLASGFRAALLPDSASSQSCSPRAHTIALLSTRSGACGARICGLCFAIPGLKSQNLSFGRFVQGVLNSKNSEIKAVVTKWLRLSNSIEESIGGVEDSARKFGPEDVLDALVAEVNNRSDSDGVKRLNQALMAHARPLMVQEVEDLCANDDTR
ncbi:unnamed protein product [Tilletia controversa]|nr:unnamed protein product [Tilletia controversa]